MFYIFCKQFFGLQKLDVFCVFLQFFLLRIYNGYFTWLGKPFFGVFEVYFINTFFYYLIADVISTIYIKLALLSAKAYREWYGMRQYQLCGLKRKSELFFQCMR